MPLRQLRVTTVSHSRPVTNGKPAWPSAWRALTRIGSLGAHVALATGLALGLGACGSGKTEVDGAGAGTQDAALADLLVTDAAAAADSETLDGAETVPDSGATDTSPEAAVCPGGTGCPCQAKSDCPWTGQCIKTPKGTVCAQFCLKLEDCPPGQTCVQGLGGADVTFICKTKWASICNPCDSNNVCLQLDASAKCIVGGNLGAACGAGCSVDSDCPTGYECKDSKDVNGDASLQCVVKGGGPCP